jgi:hypothetical protein
MAKIGRNELCPCGSGKKHKKCHGSSTHTNHAKTEQVPAERYPQIKGTWGLPSTGMFMTITKANSKVPNDPMNTAQPSGAPGKYKINFVMSRPGYNPAPENHVSFENDLPGDSHLFIGDPNEVEARMDANLPDGTKVILFGKANERGFLGRVEIESIDALSFGDANLKGYNALATVLSRLSVLSDVPANIFRMTTVELSTQNRMNSLTLPFVEQQALIFTGYAPDKGLAKFSSLYREALNSTSPN